MMDAASYLPSVDGIRDEHCGSDHGPLFCSDPSRVISVAVPSLRP